MSAILISSSLLIVLFVILLLYRMSGMKPQVVVQYGSQTMCPSCGLITSRFKARCLECDKSLLRR